MQQDQVGGPFAVIESDPGVFTSLTRRLGIKGLELVELYDIEPWAVDHLNPHGLIFCFMWRKDAHRPADFDDPAAERVWFANQLSDDACATHAILNVVLNCPNVDIGDNLRSFKADTEAMSPVMRGLAVTNSPIIRPAHNSLARPSDLRASLNNVTIMTFEAEKKKAKEKKAAAAQSSPSKPPPAKRQKISNLKSPTKKKGKAKAKYTTDSEPESESDEDDKGKEVEEEETYHFIGYVPAHGKVWELDGLKSGPLEVGELQTPLSSTSSNGHSNQGWMDIARPALRMKMVKYGGSGMDDSNIRFSLLAIVDDSYRKAHDDFEALKRERRDLEKLMDAAAPGWQQLVDQSLLQNSKHIFTNVPLPIQPPFASSSSDDFLTPFSSSFSSRRMERGMELMNFSQDLKISLWADCIRNGMGARTVLEDELNKAVKSNTDHVKRTFDYDPFIKEYIQQLHREGLLTALLDRDDDWKKKKRRGKPSPSKQG